jgi:hypothetical protein
LVFREFDRALKIGQVSLRLLDLQQSVVKLVRFGRGRFSQRAMNRSRASEGVLRPPKAMFQTL